MNENVPPGWSSVAWGTRQAGTIAAILRIAIQGTTGTRPNDD
jgi:hypothetical protein